ncbi:MAG: SRPBCC family protein, partial [Pseudomonadota bacterium]
MKRRSLLAAMTVALLPGLALAHGPTRQKVTVTAEVAAEPAEVWAGIGNFQDMSWHPAVHSSTGENGNQIDATRILTLAEENGPTIAEIL